MSTTAVRECTLASDLIQALDGGLSLDRSAALERHVQRCPRCHRQRADYQRIIGQLAAAESGADAGFRRQLLARIRQQPASPNAGAVVGGRRRMVVGAFASAAVLALGLSLGARSRSPEAPQGMHSQPAEGFVARGSESERAAAPELWIFSRAGAREYQPVGAQIHADAPLAFGFLNPDDTRYRYLMVLAVGQTGRVYWYYPSYQRAGADPAAVTISSGKHELPDEVAHPLSAGALRVVALFAARPYRVSTVEGAVRRALAGRTPSTMRRLDLADSAQVSRVIQVVGSKP